MSKVVSLTGTPISERAAEANQELIEMLEKALDRAKRGELSAVCLAYVSASGRLGNDWSITKERGFGLLASLDFLKRDLMQSTDEINVPEPDDAA